MCVLVKQQLIFDTISINNKIKSVIKTKTKTKHKFLTCMPGIAFHSLLDQAIQVGLAAMSTKAGGKCENPCSPRLITLMAAPLDHPT